MLSKVDLPAPDGPMIPHNSPGRNRPLTSFRITFVAANRKKNIVNNDLKN